MNRCNYDRKGLYQAVQNYINRNYREESTWCLDSIKNRLGSILDTRNLTITGLEYPAGKTSGKPVRKVLDALLKLTDKPFSEVLLSLIRKKGNRAADIYIKAGITKQHFSKIKNRTDYQPSKETALAFAVALQLTLNETKELLESAGFTLSKSSKRDLIVEYFIKEKIYDVDEINYNLDERGFPPLTNKRDMHRNDV